MGKTYRKDETSDPRSNKQSAKLKAKQLGRVEKQFLRSVTE
jgi:hypothetical protein